MEKMAEKPEDFNQKAYVRGYIRENIVYKKLNFNRNNGADVKMVEWLDAQPEGISNYLKRLIGDDMNKRTKK